MRSVAELILKEWNQFQQVRNEGGRASCQNHMKEFVMNRLAQFLTWDDAMRESYYEDLTEAESVGWNLLTEKYARMMRWTRLLSNPRNNSPAFVIHRSAPCI